MYRKSLIQKIRNLESSIYPKEFRMMEDIDSFEHLKQYCEDERIKIKFWKTGYLITTPTTIIDFASILPLNFKQLRGIYLYLKNIYKDSIVSLNAREGTSYKLIKYLEQKSKIIIITDYKTKWNNEFFHELEIQFTNYE